MRLINKAESRISKNKSILIGLSEIQDDRLAEEFCGDVLLIDQLPLQPIPDIFDKNVYLCGDIAMTTSYMLQGARRVSIIRELSYGYDKAVPSWPTISVGQVPILVHGVGIQYRRFFDPDEAYFQKIQTQHEFQSLTESTKPGKARRTGIYLTPVVDDADGLHFRLLRCSTNLSGPTENFQSIDTHIVDAINFQADSVFENNAQLNHVLAQIYHNTPASDSQKQTKAKISSHADKSKDMPTNGTMAFCTFYENFEHLQPMPDDPYDFGYKKSSGLTTLSFKLKQTIEHDSIENLPEAFSVTLYPGSVFLMPLSTNRLYTHEIRPSALDAERLPTRLGYVIRCSDTEAVHRDGQTYLKRNASLAKLEPPTEDGMLELRDLYSQENKTDEFIDYGDKFLFSMNEGDYQAPSSRVSNGFQQFALPTNKVSYEALLTSVRFEDSGKGRQGAVLVKVDASRGVPIVRTTTKYQLPAQKYQPVHLELAQAIQECASLPCAFNNALIERYTDRYTKMGFHTDQAQDLNTESFIAVFSCYENPDLEPSRKLVVQSKADNEEEFEFVLGHNSIVVFSTDVNQRYKHKIMLDTFIKQPENPWIGVTYRCSKTFVHPAGTHAISESGEEVGIASEEESQELYLLRRRENNETDFQYPWISYTLSESDLKVPQDLIS